MTPRRAPKPAGRFEVHAHSYVRGPHAQGGHSHADGRWCDGKFEHSHEDGSRTHEHPDTGPAGFTIDKDDWYAATHMRGGGRKRYTAAAKGEQFAYVERDPSLLTFKVIFDDGGFTDEIARSTGMSETEWTRHRDEFKAAAEGSPPAVADGEPGEGGAGEGGAAVANVALTFGLTPIYEYRKRSR